MLSRATTTAGKIKVGLALDPNAYGLLLEMCGSSREQGRFISDLVLAEARRHQAGNPDARLEALEAQLAALLQMHAS